MCSLANTTEWKRLDCDCSVGIIESIPAVVFFEIGDNNRRAVEALRNILIQRLRRGKWKSIFFILEIEYPLSKVTLLFLD